MTITGDLRGLLKGHLCSCRVLSFGAATEAEELVSMGCSCCRTLKQCFNCATVLQPAAEHHKATNRPNCAADPEPCVDCTCEHQQHRKQSASPSKYLLHPVCWWQSLQDASDPARDCCSRPPCARLQRGMSGLGNNPKSDDQQTHYQIGLVAGQEWSSQDAFVAM